MIGLSPLDTAHPSCFQPTLVRTSTWCYPGFILAMPRSSRFACTPSDSFALFRLAFATATPQRVNLATYRNSQAHSSKGTRSLHSGRSQNAPTACRHTVSGTISRPLTGVLFTFPSRYWFTIGHQGVFRLRRWSSRIHTEFHGLRATWDTARESSRFHVRGYHPLCRRFPTSSATQTICNSLPDQQL